MKKNRPGKIIKVENKEYGLRQHNSRPMVFVYKTKHNNPIGYLYFEEYCFEEELNVLLDLITNYKEFVPSIHYEIRKSVLIDNMDKLNKEFNYLMELDGNED